MQAAFQVLTDSMLLLDIVEFQCGLPYALLAFEPVAYEAQADLFPFLPRPEAIGATVLHHALLTYNTRMVELLFRVGEQPEYAAMARFGLGGVLELVCKYGTVQHLEWLHEKRDVFAKWPSSLLRETLLALEYPYRSHYPEDPATFLANKKHKVEWLMEHHPEACTFATKPSGILISNPELHDLLVKLLVADAVDLWGFARHGGRLVDAPLLELMIHKCPRAITPSLVALCAEYGKLGAIQFLHAHESELDAGCFIPGTMDAAAEGVHVDIVRFLHENRTEGCTPKAMARAALYIHLDVVKFLQENRTEGCTPTTIEDLTMSESYTMDRQAMVEYLVEHRPEAIQDPSSWWATPVTKYVRSVWAKSAALSDDPAQALRATVIQRIDLEAFKKVHQQMHPAACTVANSGSQHSLLQLAIEEEKDEIAA